MRVNLILTTVGVLVIGGCHRSAAPPPPPRERVVVREARDQYGNVIERDVVAENEPPPAPIVDVLPPRPYPAAIYIRGYWYHDRPRHRWVWVRGYWR